MVPYMEPLFFVLPKSVEISPIFVCCQRLIARNVADGFSFLANIRDLDETCCTNALSRGSIVGLKNR
jgi:hypothetical protein